MWNTLSHVVISQYVLPKKRLSSRAASPFFVTTFFAGFKRSRTNAKPARMSFSASVPCRLPEPATFHSSFGRMSARRSCSQNVSLTSSYIVRVPIASFWRSETSVRRKA